MTIKHRFYRLRPHKIQFVGNMCFSSTSFVRSHIDLHLRLLNTRLTFLTHREWWWRHQMETFSALLPFVWGIHRSPVNFPHKGQWRGALMFSLICSWINGWINNHEAGNLRRHRAQYDVIVMNLVFHYTCRAPPPPRLNCFGILFL